MKIVLMFLISFGVFASEQKAVPSIGPGQEQNSKLEGATEVEKFSIKKILTDRKAYRSFLVKTIMAGKIENRQIAETMVMRFSEKLPFSAHFMTQPIYPEILFQVSQKPESIAAATEILLEKTKLIKFFGFLLGTLILSHLLGELKFYMGVLSPGRLLFSFARFGFINGVRVGGFFYFFKANLAPLGETFLISITNLSSNYPVLFKITHVIANILSSSVNY